MIICGSRANASSLFSILSSRLYQSPKVSDREDDNGKYYSSPVQWLKEEFESPSTPQLASARKNILYKIGMIDRELAFLGDYDITVATIYCIYLSKLLQNSFNIGCLW